MSRDESLDAFMAEVREEVHARAQAGGRVRDFAAMIARAREIAPAAVSAEARAEAQAYAPVVALRRVRPVPEVRRWRGAGWLAAAAVIVIVGLGAAVRLGQREAERADGFAVPHVVEPAPGGEVEPASRRGRAKGEGSAGGAGDEAQARREVGDEARGVEPTVEPAGASGDEARARGEVDDGGRASDDEARGELRRASGDEAQAGQPGGGGEGGGRAAPGGGEARTRAAVDEVSEGTGDSRWAELDRRARAAWRRGELDEARRLFTALTRASGASGRVELAYGDLFVLARQVGDVGGLEAAWRSYLERFPRGIFAEDASAGLCRRAGSTDCWARHLAAWPEGGHADEARRALASKGP